MLEMRGVALARAWEESFGSAWVVSSDLMEGPWQGKATFQQCLRALIRADVQYERQEHDQRSYLYRLVL